MVSITYSPGKLAAPDHRAKAVHKSIISAETVEEIPRQPDPISQEYLNMLVGEGPFSEHIEQAFLLNSLPFARSTLRAFLLASAPVPDITGCTEVPGEVVHAFSRLFFDTGVFPNWLIRVAFAQQLPAGTEEQQFERDMSIWGLQLGWEYLAWKVTGDPTSLSAEEVVRHLMTDALWRSREHVFSRLTDAAAKESRAWVPQVLRAAEIVDRIGRQTDANPLESLKIHLIGADETLTHQDVTARGELLS